MREGRDAEEGRGRRTRGPSGEGRKAGARGRGGEDVAREVSRRRRQYRVLTKESRFTTNSRLISLKARIKYKNSDEYRLKRFKTN